MVFDPLGMQHSALYRRREREPQTALGHDRAGQPIDVSDKQRIWEWELLEGRPADEWRYADRERILRRAGVPGLPNFMTPNAAASLCTTGPDYLRFLLHATTTPAFTEWQTTIRSGAGWRLGFGAGWGLELIGSRRFLWQWGDNNGYKAFVVVEPSTRSGVFIFTNGDAGLRICDRVVSHVTSIEHPIFFWLA
jgi:CubicO group peptidase (beta-lactamase class C family)